MSRVLGYITPVCAFCADRELYMQAASGRTVEALAKHFDRVYMCSRVVTGPPPKPFDAPLDTPNLELIAQPFWATTLGALPHFWGITRAYLKTCRRADVLFVRGGSPYTALLYFFAAALRKPICHWIVADPVTLLRSSPRRGAVLDALALIYALQDRLVTRVGRWLTGGALICNGRQLARMLASPRTTGIVSSTIRKDEFWSRGDTCQGPRIRILFVGFLRPEKGVEYLLEAVSQLPSNVPWDLEIAGPRQFPQYCRKLDQIAAERGVSERIRWSGYLPNGRPLFERMRAADLLVLPTLSEGTPHVLVEARANSLPCISTTVGGVPSTVTNGHDALLVPPKDAPALARAIERVITDGALRRALICNGLVTAHQQTLDRFIGAVMRELNADFEPQAEALPQS